MNNKFLSTICTTAAIGIIGLAGKLIVDAFKDINKMNDDKEKLEEPVIVHTNIMQFADESPEISKDAKVLVEVAYNEAITAETPNEYREKVKYYDRLIGDIQSATTSNEFIILVKSHEAIWEEKKKEELDKAQKQHEINSKMCDLNYTLRQNELKMKPVLQAISWLGRAATK